MAALKENQNLEELQPESNTKPRVHYKNLYRYSQDFIGGIVISQSNGVSDCVKDANVSLSLNGEVVNELKTDAYGEFKFDRLTGGDYLIQISASGMPEKEIPVTLSESTYLGRIEL